MHAREQNPRVREAQADVDAAHAVVAKAKSELVPTLSLEGNARIGDDIDGFRGQTNDLQAGLVMRWDIFNGGTKQAKVQEMYRREKESRYRLDQMVREAEEDVRISWNAWDAQGKLVKELDQQSKVIGTREILEKNSLMGPLHTMGRGVVQRIDGSETEKSAVKEILKKMDDYFVHEVFSKSDFEIVRGRW